MNVKKTVFALTAVTLMFLTGIQITVYAGESAADYTDVVILSTTDMHGKCWNTNVLTGSSQGGSMLRVSSAVSQIREEYGEENVLLVDNGDLFQGTPVSQIQLLRCSSGESIDPPAMALCLKEIGYDAFVLGNHEFNYDWETMSAAYHWLEDNNVPVLAANACYDGTDAEHAAGENAFTPFQSMKMVYPVLEHLPFLLPVYWVHRLTQAMIRKPGKVIYQLTAAFQYRGK